jgi:hypothetical protein
MKRCLYGAPVRSEFAGFAKKPHAVRNQEYIRENGFGARPVSQTSWYLSIREYDPCPHSLPTFFIRHRAAFRNVIAFPAAQGPATIVPAGGRPPVVDITDPRLDSDVLVRLLPAKMPAGGIGKEKAVSLPETPFSEILYLVGFALTDNCDRKPAAALAAVTA